MRRTERRFEASEISPATWTTTRADLAASPWAFFALGVVFLALPACGPSPPEPLPETLSYEVVGHGLEEPHAEHEEATIYARGDTLVRVVATPAGATEGEVELGLYRKRGGGLERLGPEHGLSITSDDGGASFEGSATDVVGERVGLHRLYLAVARPGDLPASVELTPGDDPGAVLADGRRLVYVQELRRLDENEAGEASAEDAGEGDDAGVTEDGNSEEGNIEEDGSAEDGDLDGDAPDAG